MFYEHNGTSPVNTSNFTQTMFRTWWTLTSRPTNQWYDCNATLTECLTGERGFRNFKTFGLTKAREFPKRVHKIWLHFKYVIVNLALADSVCKCIFVHGGAVCCCCCCRCCRFFGCADNVCRHACSDACSYVVRDMLYICINVIHWRTGSVHDGPPAKFRNAPPPDIKWYVGSTNLLVVLFA